MAALTAEFVLKKALGATLRADERKLCSAFVTELFRLRIFDLAFWAFHFQFYKPGFWLKLRCAHRNRHKCSCQWPPNEWMNQFEEAQ